MSSSWQPHSWRTKQALQMPDYPDVEYLERVESQIASFPPLVFVGEAQKLKSELARVASGQAFLLQGGIARKALQNFQPIILGIPFAFSCRWHLSSLLAAVFQL